MPQSKQTTYFTYHLSAQAGLSDQLERFNLCHKLGVSLGYKYAHTPFVASRSSDNLDSFLGFNDYFPLKVEDPVLVNCKIVTIDLEALFQNHTFNNLQELQDFIRQFVLNIFTSSKKRTLVIFTLKRGKLLGKGLVPRISSLLNKLSRLQKRQNLIGKMSGWVNSLAPMGYLSDWVNSQLQDKPSLVGTLVDWLQSPRPDQLDFRSIYFQARKKRPIKSRFTDGKVKLLVHIRQGDTAVIETPWQTFVPLWKLQKQKKSPEILDINKVGDQYVPVHEYFSFLRQFLTCFNDSTFSIIVSSDGYKRGFGKLYAYRHFLNFTDEQLRELRNAEESYDQEKFAQFKTLENSLCLVGETDENLIDLIHSSIIADIIVIGTQQRMLPNLLTLYGDASKPPLLIILHKLKRPPTNKRINLDGRRAEIIPVKLDEKTKLEDVITQVQKYLDYHQLKFHHYPSRSDVKDRANQIIINAK